MSVVSSIHEQQTLLESAFAHSNEGMILTDPESNIISVNAAFTRMTGFKKDELLGQTPRIMQSGFHDREFYEQMWNSIEQNDFWQGEIWDRRQNGEVTTRNLQIKSIKDAEKKVVFYIGLMTDHSELHAMTRLANQDALTGLPNRRLFEQRLEHDIAHAKRNKTLMSLLYIDLDRFKHINDTCGHRIGDQLLVEVAQRLNSTIRAEDTAARLGGDEFVIILSEVTSAAGTRQVANKIIQAINMPFHIDGHVLNVGCSIGYSIFPEHSNNLHSLINVADSAMYQAKKAGRNRLCCS